MVLEQMDIHDQQVIRACLEAIRSEVFIDAEEYEVVSGASFDELVQVLDGFPDIDDSLEAVYLNIHGALLNLLFYPHHREQRWSEFVPVPPQEVFNVHRRWMTLMGWEVPSAEKPGMYYFNLIK